MAGGSVVLAPGTASAAPLGLTVSTTADVAANAGACGNQSVVTAPSSLSLREATCIANNRGGAVQIDVPAGTYNLINGELQLGPVAGANATLVGAGSGSTIIDAGGRSRVLDLDFNMVGGVTNAISGVTIRGGADDTYGGAGIIGGSNLNTTADSLTVTDSVITDNHANVAHPGVTNRMGGGIQFLGGSLTLQNSVVSNNSSGSSRGSGVSYEAGGDVPDEKLVVSGTTFSNNTVSTSAAGMASGGALAVAGTPGLYAISDSRFVGNSVTGTGSATPRGAAIWSQSGALSVLRSSFTGNTVSGGVDPAGGAIAVDSGSLIAQYNRFAGNVGPGSAMRLGSGFTANATSNWWGCNTGPNTTGCDTTVGSVVATPRLVLGATANPSTLAGPNATSTITASLTKDSSGAAVAGSSLGAFNGVPVSWSNVQPSGATVAPTSSVLNAGSATTSYDSTTTVGSGGVDARLDNAVASAALTVTAPQQAPAITSSNTVGFRTGVAGSFTVSTTGSPTATLTKTGTLPPGMTFVDNGDGTATVSGTPTTGGSYPLNLTASNGVNPDAVQTLTIDVGQAPAFSSPTTATFRVGTAGSFTVVATGMPTAAISRTSGTLPAGLTLTDNGDGTATLSGTPTAAGTASLGLSAANGLSPDATQVLAVQVNQAPFVTTNPSDQTVQPGTPVTFSAVATGTPTPTVQWFRYPSGGSSFVSIPGATGTSYTFTAAAGNDGEYYRAVFSNSVGDWTSTSALLRVGTAPAFTSADHASFSVGTAGSFTVTSTGVPAAALTRAGASFPSWATLTDNGNGTATLTGTPPAGSGGTYSFTLEASNGFSPRASQTFTLTVNAPPAITSPSAATFTAGTAGTFTVTTAAGFPTATTLTQTGVLPSGITFVDNQDGTATLAGTPGVGSGGDHPITLQAANGVTPTTSQNFVLTVKAAPAITTAGAATFAVGNPGSFLVKTTPGFPAAMTLTETGVLPAGVTFVDNHNGTATLAGTPAAGSGGTHALGVTATNGVLPDATQQFTLTVDESPTITQQPADATVAPGGSVTFSVAAKGFPTPVAQWQKSTDDGLTFTDIAGENADTLTLEGTLANSHSRYRAHVGSRAGQEFSAAALLTVGTVPAVLSNDHATFTIGTAGSFSVTTEGTPAPSIALTGSLPSGVTFTHEQDGSGRFAGSPAVGSAGTYPLTLTVSNGIGPDVTQAFTLTVNPSAPTAPVIGTVTSGNGSASITFTPPSSDGGAPITGYTVTSTPGNRTATGTGSPLVVTGLTNGTGYTFTVRAINAAGAGAPSAASTAVTPVDPSPISVKYGQLGGPASVLGAPTGPEYQVAGGTARNYRLGRIYYSPKTGAHEVHGRIAAKYVALGGPAGLLGFPVSDEVATAGRTGAFNHFAGADGASIFWSPKTGAWSVHGVIRTKWLAMGGERGLLGFPVSDEVTTAGRTGAFNHFAGADGASIFWSPKTGAWSVHGVIRTKWLAMGAERSRLGYPVSDEYAASGGRRSDFVHGSFSWWPNGATWVSYR